MTVWRWRRRSRRSGAVALVAALVVGVGGMFALPADAQSTGGGISLRRIDSTDAKNVHVVFQYAGDPKDVSGLKVTENGKSVDPGTVAAALDAKTPPAIVFVIDSSTSTDKNAVLSEGRKALHALVASLPQGTQLGVVTAGGEAALIQPLTTDKAAVDRAMDAITPSGDGALWEGIGRAAGQFTDNASVVPMIVLITDGNSGKGTSYETARGEVNDAGAEVFAIGVNDGSLSGDPKSLAGDTGGSYVETNKVSDISTLLPKMQPAIAGQYTFSFATATVSGVNDLTLAAGSANVRGSYVAGSVARGTRALVYDAPATTSGVKFFQNGFGKLLAVVFALVAVGLAVFALVNIVVRDDTGLSAVLRPYSEYTVKSDDDDDDDVDKGMAQTPFVQRAVELTGQFADRQGLLVKAEGALERANLPLRAAEAIFFYLAAAVVVTLLVLGLTRNFLVALIAAVLIVLLAPAVLNFMAGQRKRRFESQLPDTLQLLSGTLRAGYSMMQGVEAVSQEVQEPMGRELRRVVTEARLGRPLEEALDSVAERMGSNDFAWATMAIRIQREVGGNLSELLMTVADTMTHRERLRRDVKTLTAEGRMSAYVLGVLPIGLGLAMYSLNPDYMSLLWEDGVGQVILIGGVVLMLVGFLWMSKIVKIEI